MPFKETTFFCRFCGHHWCKEEAIRPDRNWLGNTESNYSTTTASDPYSGSNYDNNSYNDNYEPSSSQSDFGGGISDGGGAGDSW